MKLNEIFQNINQEHNDDFKTLATGKEILAYLNRHYKNGIVPDEIQNHFADRDLISNAIVLFTKNPNMKFQKSVFSYSNLWLAADLQKIDSKLLNSILTDMSYITKDFEEYEYFVKNVFKDNQILMNKWLRYAESIKNET